MTESLERKEEIRKLILLIQDAINGLYPQSGFICAQLKALQRLGFGYADWRQCPVLSEKLNQLIYWLANDHEPTLEEITRISLGREEFPYKTKRLKTE